MTHRLFTLLIIIAAAITGADASILTQRADSAYNAENYQMAVSLYRSALDKDGSSSTLYYNLGNALYRTGNLSGAIISYKRALRLDPSNSDAKANLEFVNSKIIDRQPDESSLTQKINHNILTFTSADKWAFITLICFLACLCTVAGYLFLSGTAMRKFSFFAAVFFLLMTIFTAIYSYKAATRIALKNEAIVTSPSVILSTTPRYPKNKTEEAVLLHEGAALRITDSLRVATDTVSPKWYEVEVRQGQRAWINSKDVEII